MNPILSNAIRYSGWLLCMLIAVGCTASVSAPDPASAVGATPPATPQRPAPPMSDPLPADPMISPLTIDSSCRVDADCAVKNVGNCCGAMPACVHKDSPTDPAAVQAECARKGMASTCGFRDISACTCSNNQCTPAADGLMTR